MTVHGRQEILDAIGLQGSAPGFFCRQRLGQIMEGGSGKQMQNLSLVNPAAETVDGR
jgi:hypothetical protein